MLSEIKNIIDSTFEKDFFIDAGSIKTRKKIQQQIEIFNAKFPNAIKDILANLRIEFPNAYIENFTHFFDQDRCIRFVIEPGDEKRFICQLSIYGYFSVYESPYTFKERKYIYGDKNFINKDQSAVCNNLYKCSCVLTDPPIWLDKETLTTTFFDLSVPRMFEYKITVADLLFTKHYI